MVSSDALLGLRANKGAVGLHTWATEQLRGNLGQRMLFREREARVNREKLGVNRNIHRETVRKCLRNRGMENRQMKKSQRGK